MTVTVLVTLRIKGDSAALEKVAAGDPTAFPTVSARGRAAGAISHHFYANDGEILVVDEWPDEESFMGFFHNSPEIAGFMEQAGVTAAPEISFWHKLELGDDIP
jgi:quinol monooxygenase YgiN